MVKIHGPTSSVYGYSVGWKAMRLSILIKFVILILDKFVNRLIGIVLKDLIGKIAQDIRLIFYPGRVLSAS